MTMQTTDDAAAHLAYPPRVTPFTTPFWDGLDEGVLRTTRCRDCSHMTFPPKPICPECWKSDLEWVDTSGRGTLYSYTEVSAAPATFADEAPYVLCLVDLDEGVRCVSRVLATWDELRPDMRVRLKVRDTAPVRLFDFVIDEEVSA
jgi:uncharacterized OB-fold protein